jgi:hypothetical protein
MNTRNIRRQRQPLQEQDGIMRAPLSNLRHNAIHDDAGSVSSKRSNSSRGSTRSTSSRARAASRERTGNFSINNSSHANGHGKSNGHANSHANSDAGGSNRFKLRSKANDTPSNSSRRSRIPAGVPRAASHATKASTLRAAHAHVGSSGSSVGSGSFPTFSNHNSNSSSNSNINSNNNINSHNAAAVYGAFGDHDLSQSVNDLKQNRAEAQQKRMEWAKRRGQMTEGDMTRASNGNENGNDNIRSSADSDKGVNTLHFQQQQYAPPPPSTPVSTPPTPSKRVAAEESISLTRSHLEQIIQDRIDATTSALHEEIKSQEKQISDLKFFQDLDLDKATPNTHQTPVISPEHQAMMQQLETENSHYAQTISHLKEDNLNLQANLQACNPTMNSSDAYKKALRLKSDLLDSKNLLQEEILGRERAETNLQCVKMESDGKLMEQQNKIVELERNLEERMKDLNDGVHIMKAIEDEMEGVQIELDQEREGGQELRGQFEQFEEEKNKLAKSLGEELETSKAHLEKVEERFDTEKKELEEKCQELEDEVISMKDKVLVMEEKKKKSLKELKHVHEKSVLDLRKTLDEQTEETNELQEQLHSMEEVVRMYHEKARGEIQEYGRQAEEANTQEMQAREQLQDCLVKVDDADSEIESLLKDMEMLKNELDDKDVVIKEMEETQSQLSEAVKTYSSGKAKEHQFMRDKKKWATTEKSLREELKAVKDVFSKVSDESKNLVNERDGLDGAFRQMEEENEYLKKNLNVVENDLEKVCAVLESVEDESISRIKSLEQELVRAQNMTSSRPSPRTSTEMSDLKNALRIKDEEIRQVRELASTAMNEVAQLKQRTSRASPGPSPSSEPTPRIKNASPEFNAFQSEERPRNYESRGGSSGDDDWDEMDNMRTSKPPKQSPPRQVRSQPHPSVAAESPTPQRRTIENDAIRSYMRHRRRNSRHQ